MKDNMYPCQRALLKSETIEVVGELCIAEYKYCCVVIDAKFGICTSEDEYNRFKMNCEYREYMRNHSISKLCKTYCKHMFEIFK